MEINLTHLMSGPAIVRGTQLRNLAFHAELMRLQQEFESAGVALLPLKGSFLSSKLYGDIGMRHMRDIDFFVSVADLPAAIKLIQQVGYQIEPLPLQGNKALHLVKAAWWHVECRHHQSNILVELHWRFERTHSPALERCWLEWMRISDTVQRDRYELLYLCLHGAEHEWERLKWLGDLHVLIGRMKESDWLPLLALASKLRMEVLLAETLLLLHWIFGYEPIGAGRTLLLENREQAIRLSENALMKLLDINKKPSSRLLRVWKSWQSDHQTNVRYRPHERLLYWLRANMLRQGDIISIPLPIYLMWMYPLLRPFSMIGRRFFRQHLSKSM